MSFKQPQTETDKNEKKTEICFDEYEGSEFEYPTDDDVNRSKLKKKSSLTINEKSSASSSLSSSSNLPSKSYLSNEQSKQEGQIRSFHYRSMNAYAKHIKLVNDYLQYYSGGKTLKEIFARDTSKDKTDLDVIREEIKFIWDEYDEANTWEKRLAKRYYDKLFKEYCICDLSLYKQNKIAMRWRIENEVVTGKGQFICGDKRCSLRDNLKTWEVNFGYIEHGEKKNALVKLRLCPECSIKLNYHHKKKEYIKPIKVKKRIEKVENDKEEPNISSESEDENSEDDLETKRKKIKVDKKEEEEKQVEKEKVNKDGNMIVLTGDDSMWKNKSEKVTNIEDNKAREEEFEDYLEDLFF